MTETDQRQRLKFDVYKHLTTLNSGVAVVAAGVFKISDGTLSFPLTLSFVFAGLSMLIAFFGMVAIADGFDGSPPSFFLVVWLGNCCFAGAISSLAFAIAVY